MENKTVVLTYIHTPFYGSDEFLKSAKRVGLPVHNAWQQGLYTGAVGDIMYMLYVALLKLKETYTHVIYSDGADTYFLKSFDPTDYLLISAEKCCFPDKSLEKEYPKYPTLWKYVNAGNWCGSIDTAIHFFERYELNTHKGKHVNGQLEWHHAFLNATKERYDVHLDWDCLFMQSVAFEDPGDFKIEIGRELETWPKMINSAPKLINIRTGSEPAVLHFNGRTDATWIYELYK